MKPAYLLLALLIFIGCKKQDNYKPTLPVYTEPDFELIPAKDAVWHVHGIGDNLDLSYFYSTYAVDYAALKAENTGYAESDITISTGNRDTVVGGKVYHGYKIDWKITTPDVPGDLKEYTTWYYLRGDKATMKVYEPSGGVVLDFSDSANQGTIVPFYGWADMNVYQPDNLIVNGHFLKRWTMRNTFDPKLEYFYKAIGIGGPAGLINPIFIGQVTSLDFTYKGDHVRFEYPLQ